MTETYRSPRFTVAMALDRALDCEIPLRRRLDARDAGTHEGAVKAAQTRAAHAEHHEELKKNSWSIKRTAENNSSSTYTSPAHMPNRTIESKSNGSWASYKPRTEKEGIIGGRSIRKEASGKKS
jgi:hypothetical protein